MWGVIWQMCVVHDYSIFLKRILRKPLVVLLAWYGSFDTAYFQGISELNNCNTKLDAPLRHANYTTLERQINSLKQI